MGKRKLISVPENDSDMEFGDAMEDEQMSDEVDEYFDAESHGNDSDESVDDDEEDNNDVSGDEDDNDDSDDVQKGEEMEELEKEYNELKKQEQDILSNLKRHKDEDVQKGQAVKNQMALWDKGLEIRFLLQKAFARCNRLPQEPVRSSFCSIDSDVSEAYSGVIASSKKTLNSILELQQALVENNPSIVEDVEGKPVALNSNGNADKDWSQISQMQSRMSSFRDKSIDKWQRKTQLTTGAAAIRDKLHAFNQSISGQVGSYMRDPSKMIKGMQQNRSAIAVFGNVSDATDNAKSEELAAGDPELLDDTEFYQQLLKEFLESVDPSSSEAAFYAVKRNQTKKRKVVDRRASKSRKIRYQIHEKIMNFMAPRPAEIPPHATQLFGDLFGLKSKKQASAA